MRTCNHLFTQPPCRRSGFSQCVRADAHRGPSQATSHGCRAIFHLFSRAQGQQHQERAPKAKCLLRSDMGQSCGFNPVTTSTFDCSAAAGALSARHRLGVRWQKGNEQALASTIPLSRGNERLSVPLRHPFGERGVAPRFAARTPRRSSHAWNGYLRQRSGSLPALDRFFHDLLPHPPICLNQAQHRLDAHQHLLFR